MSYVKRVNFQSYPPVYSSLPKHVRNLRVTRVLKTSLNQTSVAIEFYVKKSSSANENSQRCANILGDAAPSKTMVC